MTSTSRANALDAPEAGQAKGFRPDVEGLRAVAVGLVLLYHAGLPFVPGGFVGVDVFFVISGFLITGLLVKELQRTGTVSLAGFYARRAKRLLPAAAVVLATTAALTFLFLPRIRWSEIGGDIMAAALYFVNWRLADRSVDYLAEDSEASPVQHFWSLAVEEQFYFVWPLLLLLAAWWARRKGRSLGTELWIGLAIIAVPSLAYSIFKTSAEPAVSFFITTTRMWELAIGAAVALGLTTLARLPRTIAIVLGWSGLVAIVASALVYSTSSAWPGYAALLPALGTAAVIAAGSAAGPAGPVAILGTGAFQWVGGLSYSLYLWHWPMIVAASAYWGDLSPKRGLAVVVLSVLPAWLTLKFVENPVRFSSTTFRLPRASLRLGAVLTVTGVLAGLALVGVTAKLTSGDLANARGALVLGSNPAAYRPVDQSEGITPDPLLATEDVPYAYDRGCQVEEDAAEPVSCDFGDLGSETTLALVGDSKALQWISALDAIGEERGWRIRTFTKSACSFTSATVTSVGGGVYTSCTAWNDAVVEKLLADPPTAVLTSAGREKALNDPTDLKAGQSVDAMIAGLSDRWRRLTEAGIPVGVLRDNPAPPDEYRPVYECVDEHQDELTACTFPRTEAEHLGGGDAQLAAARGMTDVELIDLNDYLCPGDQCPPVIGNVLVYRQGSHLTRTYVDTLAPRLEEQLAPFVKRA
ncbi:MAG: acyltransferase family protein [Thermocrispum sp.]